MINIFNLFLFLSTIWIVLSFISNNLSTFFIISGIIISAIISLASWQLKIINKNFNFLFLNLGFYRHFLSIFCISFFRFIIFLFRNSFSRQKHQECLFEISVKKLLNKSELSIFISTINFIPGVSYVGVRGNKMVIYALSEEMFRKAKLDKIYHNIHKINDDSLI